MYIDEAKTDRRQRYRFDETPLLRTSGQVTQHGDVMMALWHRLISRDCILNHYCAQEWSTLAKFVDLLQGVIYRRIWPNVLK